MINQSKYHDNLPSLQFKICSQKKCRGHSNTGLHLLHACNEVNSSGCVLFNKGVVIGGVSSSKKWVWDYGKF